MTSTTQETATQDRLNRAITRALQLSPRVPFRALAEVLNVSEQTVARRYRALRRAGLLRVIGVVSAEALGQSNWIVRVDCRPTGATSLAQALAQRDDVGWVSLSAGGTQVLCTVRSRTAAAREELLLQRLPRTTQVLGMSAAMVLHNFVGGASDDWAGIESPFTAEQEDALRATAEWAAAAPAEQPVQLDAVDSALLDALAGDGRISVADLATRAGISEGRAARRVRSLFAHGVVYLDLDVPAGAFGFHHVSSLMLTVSPARLDAAGRALATCREVAYAAAITGTHNLFVSVLCRDITDLYRFLTERVGAIDGITGMEIAPTLRVVKQAGSLVSDGRLEP